LKVNQEKDLSNIIMNNINNNNQSIKGLFYTIFF